MEFASPRFLDSRESSRARVRNPGTWGAGGDEYGCETKVRMGSERSAPARLPRHGVGDPGTRRPQALRVPHPGWRSSGPLVVDDPPKTRELSARVRPIRPRKGREVRREESAVPADG